MRKAAAVHLSLLLLIPQCLAGTASPNKTKEFEKYKCKLTLPGPDWEWLDETKLKFCVGFWRNKSATFSGMLMITRPPKTVALDDKFLKDVAVKMFGESGASMISEKKGEFRGVPCYESLGAYDEEGLLIANRVFIANGCVYCIQTMGKSLPVSQAGKFEPIFSSFEFIGKPVLPSETERKQDNSIDRIMLVVFVCITIIAAGILGLRDLRRRRRLNKLMRKKTE